MEKKVFFKVSKVPQIFYICNTEGPTAYFGLNLTDIRSMDFGWPGQNFETSVLTKISIFRANLMKYKS